ncbi:MAG: hypothetical protein GY762_22325 [Proteobacteria bacterium]|nr:hypothetical protein [Pseudomonadota bacterium]
MPSSTPGEKLLVLIKKALDDNELTMTEYQEILAQAGEDSVIDSDEQRLLGQLHEMIANGTVKRTPG